MNDATPSKALTVVQEVRQKLDRMQPELRAVLPAHIEPSAFIRVSQTAINSNPDLQRCTVHSLIAACTKGAEIGLQPDGEYAAIIAYGNIARFMPMIAGLRDLVRRSGQVKDWKARVVFEGDEFDYTDGDEERLVHRPAFIAGANPKLVYSIAYLENGEISRNVMRMDEIDAIRRRSRAGNSGPWVTDYLQMALKTCLRRHYKSLPRAKDDLVRQRLTGAISAMDEADGAIDVSHQPVATEAPTLAIAAAASQRLAEAVEKSAFQSDEPEAPPPAPKPTRKRRTADERLAEAEGRASSGNASAQSAATQAGTSTQAPKSTAPSTQSASSAGAAQPSDEGRDLVYERESAQDAPYEEVSDSVDPAEQEDEEPEVLSYRDGWHSRFASKTRVPPRTLSRQEDVAAWLSGYDAAQKTVDLGNSPKTQEGSNAMLDSAVSRHFV